MAAITFSKSPCSESKLEKSAIVCAPPGLDLPEYVPVPEAALKKPAAMRLSLDQLCTPGGQKAFKPPPGLAPQSIDKPQKVFSKADSWLLAGLDDLKQKAVTPPPGLEGMESDDTSAGGQHSSESDDPGQSDDDKPSFGICLVLAERNHLKADAPMFRPSLSPSAAATLMPEPVQRTPLRTPLRTKLCSKADLFQPSASPDAATAAPGALPFVPMAAVKESWQKWNMRESMYSEHSNGISPYDANTGYYDENDGISSYDTSAGYYSEHDGICSYENQTNMYAEPEWEQEWPYEM